MRSSRIPWAAAAGLIAGLAFAAPLLQAAKPAEVWVRDEVAKFGVDRIAMLPVATYDNNREAERTVQSEFSKALKDAGYRWLSATAARTLLQMGGNADSLNAAVREDILEDARLDSLTAIRVCAQLRVDALLTVRVDRWEKREIEANESGKPSTTVQMKAALIDKTGTLLWTGDASHTAEGLYRQSRANDVYDVTGVGQNKSVTGAGGAPSYAEVLELLLEPWARSFPRKATPESKDSEP